MDLYKLIEQYYNKLVEMKNEGRIPEDVLEGFAELLEPLEERIRDLEAENEELSESLYNAIAGSDFP